MLLGGKKKPLSAVMLLYVLLDRTTVHTAAVLFFYDEHGNMYIVVDMELKGRIRAALIKAILGFEVRVK